ncbi:MAG: S9 family peptidase [Acidobacteriota bacterium]
MRTLKPHSRTLGLVVSLTTLWSAVGVAETKPFTAQDLVEMERISDPAVSPDGDRLVFVRRSTDLTANRAQTDLWLVATDGSGLRQLTSHEANDSNPRWAADGSKVYFLSSRSGSSQVWKIASDGGEASRVTDLPFDVGNLVLSSAAGPIAVTIDVFVDCPDLQCSRKRFEELENRQISGRLYEQLFVRHWDTWKDGTRSHLFVVPSEGDGEPIDVTRGRDADVPSKPFGGTDEIAFTPDGEGIVFTMRDVGATEPWSTDFDLYYAPVDGSREPDCLTEDNQAWDTGPIFSPDGKTLAYRAMQVPGYESDRFRIMLREWPEGSTRNLPEDWDLSPSTLLFSPDGKKIFATAGDRGQVSLFSIDVASGRVETIVDSGHVRSPSLAGDRIVFGRDTLTAPVDLFAIGHSGGEIERLTSINSDRLKAVEMGEAEQFSFPGWNGERVYGYVVKPARFESGGTYPVAFLIHGGPQGSFGNDFHYRWNPQTYAGAGYGVVMIDFHGSTGYGQDFTDSIAGDWGGKPLEDLQKGLAAALQQYRWLDGDRVCALGASYGGYMINWIAGNWPDRFRCLVNHDGVFDNRMMYYATEELWFPEREHGGTYWQNQEAFERHNPVNHVEDWRTPMLVVQGELDYRIPVTQSLATFTALQRQGIPSQLLYFPDENHWVLKPANSVYWHETVEAWLDRWLRGDESP